eukprot:CAMPEP_0118642102 /NCGR_PEP_ID=MMETSP0785-20121206/5660_1 /TAXON_ID=91992 /ORGANISM="Bolidomonas pacifica, Strain CCMP 1866" /LENGTH=1080 /DNA_ID=CAMNT_0006533639 /DNA_START=207 /DNA_END=3446 /DNA_ORIENTATION=-
MSHIGGSPKRNRVTPAEVTPQHREKRFSRILKKAGSLVSIVKGMSGKEGEDQVDNIAVVGKKKVAHKAELMKNIRSGRNMCLSKGKKKEDGARSFSALKPEMKCLRLILGGRASNSIEDLKPRVSGREGSVREGSMKKIGGVRTQLSSTEKAMHNSFKGFKGRDSLKRRGSVNQDMIGLDEPKLVNTDGEWAVHPDDKDYQRWFMLTLLLVVYNSVMLPIDLMFYDLPEMQTSSTSFWFWFDTLIDFTFLLDLWITFRVGFIDEEDGGSLCVSRAKIKYRYIWKGTFFIDLVSSIPFDLIILIILGENDKDDDNTTVLSVLALAKTFRLLRINRLAKYLSNQGIVSFIRIFRIIFGYLMLAHWGGCIFLLIMKSRQDENRTWLAKYAFDNGYATDLGGEYEVNYSFSPCATNVTAVGNDSIENLCYTIPWLDQYWIVMYQSMMIMMGESIETYSNPERIFALGMSLVGACLTSMMFGQMVQIVSGMDREESRYEDMMSNVADQVSQLALLPETHERIKDYYEFQWRMNSGMDRKQFLASLSPCLRTEILLSVYADVVSNVPFFQVPEAPDLITMIVLFLDTAFYLPSDIIVHEGELTTNQSCLYFLTLGTVAVFKEDKPDKALVKMNEGSYFGEMGYLSLGSKRTSSICALTNCDIAMLKFQDIDVLIEMYPAFALKMSKEGRKNMEKYRTTAKFTQPIYLDKQAGTTRKRKESRAVALLSPGAQGFTSTLHQDLDDLKEDEIEAFMPNITPRASMKKEAGGEEEDGKNGVLYTSAEIQSISDRAKNFKNTSRNPVMPSGQGHHSSSSPHGSGNSSPRGYRSGNATPRGRVSGKRTPRGTLIHGEADYAPQYAEGTPSGSLKYDEGNGNDYGSEIPQSISLRGSMTLDPELEPSPRGSAGASPRESSGRDTEQGPINLPEIRKQISNVLVEDARKRRSEMRPTNPPQQMSSARSSMRLSPQSRGGSIRGSMLLYPEVESQQDRGGRSRQGSVLMPGSMPGSQRGSILMPGSQMGSASMSTAGSIRGSLILDPEVEPHMRNMSVEDYGGIEAFDEAMQNISEKESESELDRTTNIIVLASA